VLLLKRLHVREKETLPLKLQKEVQLQGEENALPVRKAALREKLLRERLPLREKAALREKLLREKAALRERHLRERLPLRNEEGNQSFRLKNLFLFF
jgi:hypothetical protein